MGQLRVGVQLCITHSKPVFRAAAGGSWDQSGGYDYNAWGGGYASAGYGGGGAYGGGGYGAPVSVVCTNDFKNAFITGSRTRSWLHSARRFSRTRKRQSRVRNFCRCSRIHMVFPAANDQPTETTVATRRRPINRPEATVVVAVILLAM
jgi:hypothetical protein